MAPPTQPLPSLLEVWVLQQQQFRAEAYSTPEAIRIRQRPKLYAPIYACDPIPPSCNFILFDSQSLLLSPQNPIPTPSHASQLAAAHRLKNIATYHLKNAASSELRWWDLGSGLDLIFIRLGHVLVLPRFLHCPVFLPAPAWELLLVGNQFVTKSGQNYKYSS